MLSIEQALTYQELGPAQRELYEGFLHDARALAARITREFPTTSSEAQQAYSNLTQCAMWIRQGIARSGTQNAAARTGV